MSARLRTLAAPEKAKASAKICGHLSRSALFHEARCIASFAGLASEPDLSLFHAEILDRGKRLVFPRVVPGALEFRAPDHDEAWLIGRHGPREPDPARSALVAPAEIDLVLTPGLAFAAGGFRLGRGGGYYDRWLAGEGAVESRGAGTVGVCFFCQIEPRLPVAEHDQRVNHLVTEEGWLLL